jgi:lipopolysaccharide transport system ATP-binding protein
MSETVIRVENLSKKYLLDHQQEGRSNYKSIKESLPNAISSLSKKILSPRSEKGFKPSQEEFWALKDVSFEIKQGDRVGIIGRNGAGKSTLLKVLSRITEPTSGRIGINGRIASLLEVGTGFHPELTGRENIFLNGAVLGMSRVEIQRKFDEIVDFAEVEKFLDTPVKRYSSGMYVRLAFAVAAHLEPEILIVDEVLAVGDAQFQKKCLNKMGEVASEGRTVLFVSHNVSAIKTLCSKAVYLAKGQVKEVGKAEDIITNYMSELFQNSKNDLSNLRLQGYGKTIKFIDIQLLAENSQNMYFGEQIRYSLTLHAEEKHDGLSIGSSIFNAEGACVGTLITKENFSIDANQTITLNLTIPNFNLAPGSYYAGFSIGQGKLGETSRLDLDIVIGQPNFQVIALSKSSNEIAQWVSNWGNIVIKDSYLIVTNQDVLLASK